MFFCTHNFKVRTLFLEPIIVFVELPILLKFIKKLKNVVPLGGPNKTTSIAFKAIFCLCIGSRIPNTVLT